MEQIDLMFAILRKELHGRVIDGKEVIVDYVYDHKVVDVAEYHWVVLYVISESAKFFDVGATKYVKDWVVAIDLRTESKEAYQWVKELVFDAFLKDENKKKVFMPKDEFDAVINPVGVRRKGVYLQRVIVDDEQLDQLHESMYVKVMGDKESVGWVVLIEGNDVYVFEKVGMFILMYPEAVRELSDRMKALFRCVIEVGGRSVVW